MTKLKCLYCSQEIDKEKDIGLYSKANSRRYAHNNCIEEHRKKEIIIEKIHNKMLQLLGANYNGNKISKQIKSLVSQGKSEVGILLSLQYWYDYKKMSAAEANGGIGIVEYIYGEALDFYDRLEKAKSQQIKSDSIKSPQVSEYIVKPQYIRKPIGLNLFELR